jgi:prepilin-type N-terminal cleavage/methylation domain-containing protein/prepilin-type processing-associated H-X9-DG protein
MIKKTGNKFDVPGKGFTLIELLVVISVIAVLMAILLPSLNKAREQAKKVLCASNSKQVAMALLLNAADNDGMLVPDRSFYRGSPWAYYKNMELAQQPWDAALAQQWSTSKTDAMKKYLHCPSDKKPRSKDISDAYAASFQNVDGTPLPRSYGPNITLYNGIWWYVQNYRRKTNPELSGDGSCRPAKESQVAQPGSVILVGENHLGNTADYGDSSGYGNVQGSNHGAIFEKPKLHTATYGGKPAFTENQHSLHKDGGNYAFVDGHVSWHGLVKGADYLSGQPFKGLEYPNNWRWQPQKKYP